jgi:hypothetical protein
MPVYGVENQDGQYVACRERHSTPLRGGDGRPIALLPGWIPTKVIAGHDAIQVLELQHDDGQRAVWFLDAEFTFVSNSVLGLSDHDRQSVLADVKRVRRTVWQQLVCGTTRAIDEDTQSYHQIIELILNGLPKTSHGRGSGPAVNVILERTEGSRSALASFQGSMGFGMNLDAVRTIFEGDFVDVVASAVTSGKLRFASPVDGTSLYTDVGVYLGEFTIAYKLSDEVCDCTFFVVVSLWNSRVVAIYFPSAEITVYPDQLSEKLLHEFIRAPVDQALEDHVAAYSLELERYLLAPHRVMCLFLGHHHLGHHLWNELSGLDALLKRVDPNAIPAILVVAPQHTEMYGKVDQIFPEVARQVNRTLGSWEELGRFGYRHSCCLLRPTTEYVSSRLARRIVQVNERSNGLAGEKLRFRELSASGFRTVMLGLRVENRTLVDPTAVLIDIVDLLRAEMGRVAIVIDGHNARGLAGSASMHRSNGEALASRAPPDVEASIADEIADHFNGHADVVVKSLIGAPVNWSIFWCNRSEFFVTPWGAGLAKYRWICNRPGLVLVGKTFLRHAGCRTIHLYDSPHTMEAPTPLYFNSADEVEDDMTAPPLIDMGESNRVNFRLAPMALHGKLRQLVRG